jgi:hypothetical protein
VLRMPPSAARAQGLPATIISRHIRFSPIFFGTHGREHNLALPERKNSVRLRHLAHAPLPSCDGCQRAGLQLRRTAAAEGLRPAHKKSIQA